MAVTDEQVATLRAQLSGKLDEHLERLSRLEHAETASGYAALVSASFTLAAHQTFKKADPATVTRYVADVRARTEDAAEIDPRVAERLLLATFTDEQISDIGIRARYETQLMLLAALISNYRLNDAQLDQFLSKARKIADGWISDPAR